MAVSSDPNRRSDDRLFRDRLSDQLPGQAALEHHQDAIAETHELQRISRIDENSYASRRDLPDLAIDVAPGFDVHASRWVVHEEDARSRREPFPKHDLL